MVAGTYFLLNNGQKQQQIASNQLAANDLPPGGNKAVLTLADGTKIILDNAANGNLANQGNTKVIKLDEQIVYKASGNNSEVYYNTISTPRGGVYQLVLADGSKVWLNSSSSLHYPTSFTGKERKVEITGEAYFEVARNSSMPFKINIAGKEEVEVLGTHFNINAYPDEPAINTTLLEGSVKITDLADHNSSYIAPGQQAQLSSNGKIRLIGNPDIEAVVAWKNGSFIFNSQNIGDIMRQVGRWYDVDISYSGEISHETYSGIVSRNNNVSVVLKIMEEGGVKFRIEGKKIIVLH
jgi:transmembrane sensor